MLQPMWLQSVRHDLATEQQGARLLVCAVGLFKGSGDCNAQPGSSDFEGRVLWGMEGTLLGQVKGGQW